MTEKACGMGSVEGRVIREEGAVEAHMKADTVVALKAGDKRKVGALRTVVAALKKERIDAGAKPSEADEFTILGRERKRRLETVDVYEQGGRKDLADQERYEAELIGGYLPTELSDDELTALIDEAVAASAASTMKEMGKVMAQLMPKVAGRADGRRVSEAVRARLSG
jgi:uncharacterized protein YqeY